LAPLFAYIPNPLKRQNVTLRGCNGQVLVTVGGCVGVAGGVAPVFTAF